jgi:hypothetical protein
MTTPGHISVNPVHPVEDRDPHDSICSEGHDDTKSLVVLESR